VLRFVSLFYKSNATGLESKILLFRPAVTNVFICRNTFSCDFLTFEKKNRFIGPLLLNLSLGCTINLTEYWGVRY